MMDDFIDSKFCASCERFHDENSDCDLEVLDHLEKYRAFIKEHTRCEFCNSWYDDEPVKVIVASNLKYFCSACHESHPQYLTLGKYYLEAGL